MQGMWSEEYRPRRLEDCILPDRIYRLLSAIQSSAGLPHLLMLGPYGSGKTTVANILTERRSKLILGPPYDARSRLLEDVKRYLTHYHLPDLNNDKKAVLYFEEAQ